MKSESKDELKVNLAFLRNGNTDEIDISVPSDFLDVHDAYLFFFGDVEIQGEAYVIDEHLILHFDILAHAIVPCTICNGEAEVDIKLHNFYHVADISSQSRQLFDYSGIIREEILLECPQYSECNTGQCPEREIVKEYMKSQSSEVIEEPSTLPII